MAQLKLPTRTAQKKSEDDSLGIVKYKLGDLGIFRGLTENDYGIDVDLELEESGEVTGRSVKIQVKSSKKLKIRKNGTPAVSGIKQSTLNYWCQIAFRTSVIAYVVDLDSEKIYVTADLFWQATKLLDGGSSTKTITFLPEGPDNVALAKIVTAIQAFQPTMSDFVTAHTLALRSIKSFLQLLADAFHYDAGTELDEAVFRDLLQACRVLMWNDGEELWTDESDQRGWQRVEYWRRKSEADGWDGLSCYAGQPILSVLIPALFQELRGLQKVVMAGKFFWAHQDPEYLALMYDTTIPDTDKTDALIEWSYDYDQRTRIVDGMGAYLAQQARTPPAKPKKARKAVTASGKTSLRD